MKYFKLIDNNTIVGIVTSNNFVCYDPITDCYLRANEQVGEYANYKGAFYRSGWMQPYTQYQPYKEVGIINITEEEYNIYKEAFINQDTIEQAEEIEPLNPDENYIDPVDIASIEFIRLSKINEMSYACRTTIEKGFDLWILDNKYHHFSLTTQDQLNLMSISTQLETVELIPYHADGEASQFYTVEEIKQIIAAATLFKNYHTAYYNALKNYINSLETIEEIAAITYGIKIPDEYQTEVLKTIEQEMTNYESH